MPAGAIPAHRHEEWFPSQHEQIAAFHLAVNRCPRLKGKSRAIRQYQQIPFRQNRVALEFSEPDEPRVQSCERALEACPADGSIVDGRKALLNEHHGPTKAGDDK